MRPSRHARTGPATGVLGVLVTACGSTSAPPAHPAPARQRRAAAHLTISRYAYHAAAISVVPGTKITFSNHDQTAHTATSTKTGFDTGTIVPGKNATVVVTKPGTYSYYCQFHAFMHGTITVR